MFSTFVMLYCIILQGKLELAIILMLEYVNRLQNAESCLHFLASKRPLNQVGAPYISNEAAYVIRMAIASR